MATQEMPRIPAHILETLRRETGVPFWKEGNAAPESETFSQGKPYAVTMTIPGVRDSANAYFDYWMYFEDRNLRTHAQCFSEETVKKPVPDDSSPTHYHIVLQGATPQELETTVNVFCKDLPQHPELMNTWLKSNPSYFVKALKGIVTDEEKQTLEQLSYPPKVYQLDTFLHHLAAQAVSRSSPKQARIASRTLDIIAEHVPALQENIHAMRASSRLPALIGDDGTYHLTDSMRIRKDGQAETEPFYNVQVVWGDKQVANISTYTVSFDCTNVSQAQELRLHILDALKEVANSKTQFMPLNGEKNISFTETDGLHGAFVTLKNDDKTLEIYPPLVLDEVWKLYASLAEVIKPVPDVARTMDQARWSEYRGAIEGYGDGGFKGGTSAGHLDDPALQRGAYGHLSPEQHFDAMVMDIAGMLARTGDVQTAGSQVIQMSHLTLQGALRSPDNAYPDIKGLLSGTASKKSGEVTTSEYNALVQERAAGLAKHVIDCMRQAGAAPAASDGLSDQLLDASLQLNAKVRTGDEETTQQRARASFERWHDRLAARSAAALRDPKLRDRRESLREAMGGIKKEPSAAKGDRTDWLVSLEGALGKGPADEPMLLERPYPNPYDDKAPPYWSRNGDKSVMPPRFDLPKELEAVLAREGSNINGAHVAGLLQADAVTIIQPKKERR